MSLLDRFLATAREKRRTVVFPEGTDDRILRAAAQVKKDGIGVPLLIGGKDEVAAKAQTAGADLSGIEVLDPGSSPLLPEFAALYALRRKNISAGIAERLVKKNLMFGGMLLAAGKADVMIAGAASTTASVIQAASLTLGYEEGINTPSSFFIMILPDGGVLFYADCAVNIDPNPDQLADIGVATGRSYRRLMNADPKVAFLSFSTRGSASHPFIDKVTAALAKAREKAPDLPMDGEFQADTALSAAVAAKKIKEPGAVAGAANVLIFPDLNAGNIAYKLTQYLAKAAAYGPVLQGFAKPVSDLSRGAKPDDIVGVTAIVCASS